MEKKLGNGTEVETNINDSKNNMENQLTNQMKKIQELTNTIKSQKTMYNFDFLGLLNQSQADLIKNFENVTIVLVCGPEDRAEAIAKKLVKILRIREYTKLGTSEFYSIFKTNNILSCSHGMGTQSINIFLNELLNLLKVAKVNFQNLQIIRIGSSGGIGVNAGTLVLTSSMLNPLTLKPEWIYHSCGIEYKQECRFDAEINNCIKAIAKAKKIELEVGKSVTTPCYYEGQARLDGALCEYQMKDKDNYLQSLHKLGARNFEMEGAIISAMCSKQNIRCCMLCVAYLNRLHEDSVPAKHSAEERHQWMENAIDIIVQYIVQFGLKKP